MQRDDETDRAGGRVTDARASRAVPMWIVGFTLACVLGAILIHADYGITWDESVQSRYGELVVDYFLSGMRDTRCNDFHDLRYYGALFESACAAIYRFAGTKQFETRHLLIAMAGVLTILAVMLFGRLFRDPWIPVFAGLALLLMPRFFGHAFNNSKDIPFACGFAWAMLAITRMVLGETVRWRDALLTGLAIGLALSMRVGGVILFFFLAIAVVAKMVQRGGFRSLAGDRRDRKRSHAYAAGPALGKAVSVVGVAWIAMVIAWPWAHENIIFNPIAAMRTTTSFPAVKLMFYGGEMITSENIPRFYLPWYLLISTPLPMLSLGIAGLVAVAAHLKDRRKGTQSLAGLMVVSWFFLPVLYFVITRPTVYDGIRHFLFLLPPVALLVGIGAAWICRLAASARIKAALTAVMLVLILWPSRDLVVLHPYQSCFFNSLVGGVRRAWKSYETDYWVSSYKEAAEWINARSAEVDRPLTVLIAANEYSLPCAQHYLVPGVLVHAVGYTGLNMPLPEFADYYVATTRRGFHLNFTNAPVVHTIGRDGAVFTVIKAREGTTLPRR